MSFHERFHPHHHVTIWAVAALVVALASSVYTGSTVAQNERGPSEKTRQFFGDEGDGEDGDMPAECRGGGSGYQGTPGYQGTYPPGPYGTYQYNYTPTPGSTYQYNYTPTPGSTYEQNYTPTPYPSPTYSYTPTGTVGGESIGPSEEACRNAILGRIKGKMQGFVNKVNTFIAKMDAVLAVSAKLNSSISTLQGVDVNQIKTLLVSIDGDAKKLKDFFSSMRTKMEDFLKDPKFERLEQSFSGGEADESARAADRLVNNLEKLEKLLNDAAQRAGGTPIRTPTR